MEPITASLLIASAISGIVGNRADDALCRVMQSVRERLQQGGRPVNHDLQKATRKAYLQATLALLDARLHELGTAPHLLQRDIRHLFRLPDEPSQLLKARREILRELKQLSNAAYIPPPSEAEQQLELLLQPQGVAAQQRAEDLKARLKAQLLQELIEKWGVEPSQRLQEMLQNGWQDTDHGKTITLDWFALLCAFFAQELKQNQRVANIFQSQLLANLSVEEVFIDYNAFTQQLGQLAGDALARLQQIEQTLAQLREKQTEGFQLLQQRLDEYLPTLITRAGEIQQLLETVREELQRRPLYEKYIGLELTQRTARVITAHTTLFVGREVELEQLDALFAQPSGTLAITAPAGYGKTALLANWIDLRHQNGCFIAYHFFRKEYDDANRLDSIPNALFNLLRQLYIYYGHDRELPPRDEGLLRDAILGLLQEQGARDDEPLVLLLDGLDEAEKPLLLTLPNPLPEGVYVVVSSRAELNETPDALRSWMHAWAQHLHLQCLSRAAVAEYLARAGDGELEPYAQDENFVALVMHKTEGYPLHLRFLVDDLLRAAKAGGDVPAALKRTPAGFDAYVREQLRRLAQSLANAPKVQRLFALLATALGALGERDLETLAALNAFELAALPHEATRWFSITERDGERFYAFTHPLLGDAFERALGALAQEARQQLRDYCARWGEHKSPYALRHYPAHLREAGDNDALYALARNGAFLQAQRDALPAEPDLPLRTIQTALEAAIDQQNAPVIAEMLLRHAHRAAQAETPLDALRQGNLQRAIGLAKQLMERDYKVGTLWLLLLAWNRHLAGDASGAERCLAEVTKWWEGKTLEKLSNWQEATMVFLLTPLVHLPSASKVAVQTLRDEGRKALVSGWAQAGAYEQAVQAAQQIERAHVRSWALSRIAQALAQAGQREQAQQVLQEALQAARQIEEADDRSEALSGIAQALAQAGQREQAQQVLQEALQAARQIERAAYRSGALRGIAQALAQAGQREQAQQVLQEALQAARQIEEAVYRSEALSRIAQALAQAGAYEQAVQTAQQIERAHVRSEALRGIAQALAQAGQREQVQQTLQEAWTAARTASQFSALWQVAQTAAQAGFDELAVDYAQQIAGDRSKGLPKVLDALAERGAKGAFLALLPLCAWEMTTALRACAGLIRFYPDEAAAIAEQMRAQG